MIDTALVLVTTIGVVELVGFFVLLVLLSLLVSASITFVQPYERYVVTDGDGVENVLEEGVHVTSPVGWGNETIDVRSMTYEGKAVDLETSDGEEVEFDVSYTYRVTDPAAAVMETDDYRAPPGTDWSDHQCAIYELMGEIVIDHVERRRWDELADAEADIAAACERDLATAIEDFGVELGEFCVDGVERTE